MGRVGLLHPDARVELIEGEIIDMSPVGREHRAIVNRIDATLQRALGDRAVVQVQASVVLSDISEPEPDVAVLRWRGDFYLARDPGPHDIAVLVEVGASSARYDRLVKAPLYARSGVPEVWLVDLHTWALHVLTRPGDTGYAQTRTLGPTDLVTIFDVELQVDALLGPRPDRGADTSR